MEAEAEPLGSQLAFRTIKLTSNDLRGRAARDRAAGGSAGNARDHRDGRGHATSGRVARSNTDGRVGDGRNAGGHGDDRGSSNRVARRDGRGAGRGSRGDNAAAAGDTTAGDDSAGGGDSGSTRGAAAAGSTGTGRSGGLVGRAVGDGRTARGDGDILSLVDGLNVTVGHSGSKAGEESDGSSSETHCDCFDFHEKETVKAVKIKRFWELLKESVDSW